MNREEELNARQRELDERERALDAREKKLDAFSASVKEKKEEWYDHVKLNERQLTIIIRVNYGLLGLVAVLIILEAAGIFKLG